MGRFDIRVDKSPIEVEVVDLLGSGDKRAIKLIDEHYGHTLFSLAYDIVKNGPLAEDIVQEVLIKIWKKGKMYNKDRASLYSWLKRIVYYTSLDKVRLVSYKNTNRDVDLREAFSLSGSSVNLDYFELRTFLGFLPKKNREVIQMNYIEGYSHSEISKKLGIPLGTVKTRIKIGIDILKKYYTPKRRIWSK